MQGRVLVILAALVAVAVAAFASLGGGGSDGDAGGDRPDDAVVLPFAFSPEKETLLAPLIERFNDSGAKAGGRPVVIEGKVVSSGEAQAQIARGRLQPVLWSPASSFWGRLANLDADRPLVDDDAPSIVRTPLVIAMWQQLAEAYGHPRRSLGFRDLAKLATGGWAAVGKPQFGSFKYVHTNPDFSTSGLSAVAASYYAAAGKLEGLTEADVRSKAVRGQVREIERSIQHYGDTTLFIAEEMRRGGLGYASAVAMEETTLLDFNRRAPRGQRLVAIYPREGTFFSDNPLFTLQGPWVDATEKQGAAAFARFLADEVDAELAGRFGFRPADPDAQPAGLVSPGNGADPAQPKRVLRVPEPKVLARIKSAWRADRKPANVLLVLDNSGSMGEEGKLEQAKEGLLTFLREVSDADAVGLWKFSNEITPLVEIAPMRTNRGPLRDALAAVFPEEDTRVNDSAIEAVRAVEQRADDDHISAVVLLTDGADTASNRSAEQVERELRRQIEKEGGGQVRLFTIAYGAEPEEDVLAKFAAATGGKAFVASTDDIEQVYRSISSFF